MSTAGRWTKDQMAALVARDMPTLERLHAPGYELVTPAGRVFSREQLLDAVWGSDVYVETRTVDVHIGRLRKALTKGGGEDPIRTVRSAGYALNAN